MNALLKIVLVIVLIVAGLTTFSWYRKVSTVEEACLADSGSAIVGIFTGGKQALCSCVSEKTRTFYGIDDAFSDLSEEDLPALKSSYEHALRSCTGF